MVVNVVVIQIKRNDATRSIELIAPLRNDVRLRGTYVITFERSALIFFLIRVIDTVQKSSLYLTTQRESLSGLHVTCIVQLLLIHFLSQRGVTSTGCMRSWRLKDVHQLRTSQEGQRKHRGESTSYNVYLENRNFKEWKGNPMNAKFCLFTAIPHD